MFGKGTLDRLSVVQARELIGDAFAGELRRPAVRIVEQANGDKARLLAMSNQCRVPAGTEIRSFFSHNTA